MDDLKRLTQGFVSQQAILAFAEAHPLIEAEIVSIVRILKPDLQSRSAATKASATAASTTVPTAAQIPVGPGFLTLQDMPSLVPRGKLDVEIGEWGIALRPKLSAKEAAEGAPAPAPILLHNSNVVGVFHVAVKDKYKSGPAGLTHYVLLACSTPVMVGKTAYSVLGFSESGTAWAKLPATATGTRAVDSGLLKDSASLTGLAGSSATSWSAPDALHLLKGCLSAVYGRIGEMDRSIFVSSESASSVKCYLKANEGQLFPLRRALIWTGKPLLVLPLSAVKEIKVGRGGGARTFDLDVLMAAPAVGTGKPVIYQFGMLDANELQPLSDYVSTRTLGGAAASAPAATPAVVPSTAGMEAGSSGAAVQIAAPVASAAPPKAANNMNEGDSDEEEGAGRAGVDDEGEEEEDSDEEYQEGDSEEEEYEGEGDEDDDEEDDDDGSEGYGGAGSSGAGRGKKPQKPQVDRSEHDEGEEEGGEEAASGADEDDEDEDLGDDEDDDDLAALLEDAGEDAAPARRRAGPGGGAGSASSSSATAAVAMEEEPEQSWADKLKSRKRRAAAVAATSSAPEPAGPSSAAAAPATDDETEEGGPTAKHQRVDS